MKVCGFLSGKVKVLPGDFVVKEHISLKPAANGKNSYYLYELTKTGWNTLDALMRIAKENRIPLRSISYAGKKDRYGITHQYITSRKKLEWNNSRGIQLRYAGNVEREIEAKDIVENEFWITIRNVQEKELPFLEKNLESLMRDGIPNYYDMQRFHSFHAREGVAILFALASRHEKFLQQFLTHALPTESGEAKDRKHALRMYWGDWKKCRELAKTKLEKNIFGYLYRNRDSIDWKKVFLYLPEEEIRFQFSIFQSYVWNYTLRFLLEDRTEDLYYFKTRIGYFPFLKRNRDTVKSDEELPLLHPSNFDNPRYNKYFEKAIRHLVTEYLDNENPEWNWNLRIKNQGLATGKRKIIFYPGKMEILEISGDDIYKNRKKITLHFFLQSGEYATMVVKRILLRTKQNEG